MDNRIFNNNDYISSTVPSIDSGNNYKHAYSIETE